MATPALKLRAVKHSLLYKRVPEQQPTKYILSDCLLVTQKTIIVNHNSTSTSATTTKSRTGRTSNHSPSRSLGYKTEDTIISDGNGNALPNKRTHHHLTVPRQRRATKPNTLYRTFKPPPLPTPEPSPRRDHSLCNDNNTNYNQFSCPVINVRIKKKSAVEREKNAQSSTPRPVVPSVSHDYNEVIANGDSSNDDHNHNIVENRDPKTSEKFVQTRRTSVNVKVKMKECCEKEASTVNETKPSNKSIDNPTAKTPMDVNNKVHNTVSAHSSISKVHNLKSSLWKQTESVNKTDSLWEVPTRHVRLNRNHRRELKRSKTSTGYYQDRKENLPVRSTKSATARPQRCPTAPPSNPDHHHLSLGESEVRMTCLKLEEYLYNNNLPRFQETFLTYSPADKDRLVDFKDTASTANIFFRACGLVKIAFVRFLLEQCDPDLELRGPFFLLDDHTQYLVTPLWQAAASGSLQLVRILKENGADINAISDTGSSPLLAACYMARVDVATYLVANKAAVNSCNAKGLTSLMNAVQNVDLVRLLVLNGAEINRADNRGNTSMHFAVEEGRVKTVKILFELGGNPLIVNKDGFTAVQSAAKYRHKDVLEYLLQVSPLKVVNIIDVYEMIGAMVIMMDDDLDEGFVYLHKATTLRYLNKSQIVHKKLSASLLTDHEHETEFTNVQQLTKIASDSTKLRTQALMIYERQWGSSHDNFLQLLLYCGATFADSLNFREAANLWRLSYQLHFEKYVGKQQDIKIYDPFNYNLLKSLGFIMKLLFQWRKVLASRSLIEGNEDVKSEPKDTSVYDSYQICEINVRRVVCLLSKHCVTAYKWLNDQSPLRSTRYKEAFYLLLRSAICALLVYVESFSRDERNDDVWEDVQYLIKLNPRGEQNQTLLHMCLCPRTLNKLDLDISDTLITWPSLTVINIMLILGANPTHSNKDGNTPLHFAAMLRKEGILSEDNRIIQSLLSLGAHADQVNNLGQTAYDLLGSKDDGRHNTMFQKAVSLKCLSARVITAYGIQYIGEVPTSLYSFIELHRSVHAKQRSVESCWKDH